MNEIYFIELNISPYVLFMFIVLNSINKTLKKFNKVIIFYLFLQKEHSSVTRRTMATRLPIHFSRPFVHIHQHPPVKHHTLPLLSRTSRLTPTFANANLVSARAGVTTAECATSQLRPKSHPPKPTLLKSTMKRPLSQHLTLILNYQIFLRLRT